MNEKDISANQDVEFIWAERPEVIIREKKDYKHSKERITKESLNDFLTFEANICRVEYMDDNENKCKDLYLYIDVLNTVDKPIVREEERYWNCLFIIHGARLAPQKVEDFSCTITQERLDELRKMLSYRTLYMSFRELLTDGCDDVSIYYKEGVIRLSGYGTDANSSSLWAKFEFEFDSVSCYFDEIYDYMTGETLG